jgi:excisionase family DNA binding protein
MSQLSTGLSRQEKRASAGKPVTVDKAPLAVTPREASRLLSTGITHIYDLLRAGKLQGFHSGRARRVSLQSIHDYVARQLAAANTQSPRRGRRERP